jgi:hypothetical protein
MKAGYQNHPQDCVHHEPGVCQYPELLFKNDTLMKRARSLSELTTPDQYFIMYNCTDQITHCDPANGVPGPDNTVIGLVYLLLNANENPNCFATNPTDPACPKLELAVTPFAFGKDLETVPGDERDSHPAAANVTVKNLIVEKYANPVQFGAIGNHYPGYDWLVDGNEVRLNHGVGIKFHGRATVSSNYVHDNGQIGITGGGTTQAGLIEDAGIVEKNDIARNNKEEVGFDSGFEAGGSKFALSKGLAVIYNYVHHNRGPALWTDLSNVDTTYFGNRIEFNREGTPGNDDGYGIFHEVSFSANIFNNLVRHNEGSAIRADNSRDINIHNNDVIVGSIGDGIQIHQRSRPGVYISGAPPNEELQYCTWHNTVHDNTTVFESENGLTGGIDERGGNALANCVTDPFSGNIDPSLPAMSFYSPPIVFFSTDIYVDKEVNQKHWWWEDNILTFCEFKMKGQEPGGRLFVGGLSPVLARCRGR